MAKGFVESHGETNSGPCCEKTCLHGFRPDHDHQPAQLQTLARKLEQVEPQPFPDSPKKMCRSDCAFVVGMQQSLVFGRLGQNKPRQGSR